MSKDDLDFGSPWPDGVISFEDRKLRVSVETVELLESLLRDARRGAVSGIAVAVLRANDEYEMRLRGSCAEQENCMHMAGMFAAMQKIVLSLQD